MMKKKRSVTSKYDYDMICKNNMEKMLYSSIIALFWKFLGFSLSVIILRKESTT